VDARLINKTRGAKGEERFVLEITVREGMNREVRRVLARVGLRVKRLKRIRFGSLTLGRLPEGAYQKLTSEEVSELKEKLRMGPGAKKKNSKKKKSSKRSSGK
ncbi:MAG: pseudouridine synthase, partial [Planctomycetota bacterium]|nr:pseudouridine synthase [Planctomycetota bacterium]